jgi:ubiquinone/menaquinone biosynthesis C-methylase UbiE
MSPLEKLWLRRMRSDLLPRASGRVLEVGIGTGANLPFYPSSARLTAVDESPDMISFATRRADSLKQSVSFNQADTEHLCFRSDSFDSVVASLVLCSVVDQSAALRELHRVLRKPGGKLLLLEHVRPRQPLFARLADLVNIPWYAFNGRCQLNRRTEDAVVQAGFGLQNMEARAGGLLRLLVARIR